MRPRIGFAQPRCGSQLLALQRHPRGVLLRPEQDRAEDELAHRGGVQAARVRDGDPGRRRAPARSRSSTPAPARAIQRSRGARRRSPSGSSPQRTSAAARSSAAASLSTSSRESTASTPGRARIASRSASDSGKVLTIRRRATPGTVALRRRSRIRREDPVFISVSSCAGTAPAGSSGARYVGERRPGLRGTR